MATDEEVEWMQVQVLELTSKAENLALLPVALSAIHDCLEELRDFMEESGTDRSREFNPRLERIAEITHLLM
jgi:hypothetical protein